MRHPPFSAPVTPRTLLGPWSASTPPPRPPPHITPPCHPLPLLRLAPGAPAEITAFTAVAPRQQAPATVTPHPLLEHAAKHYRQKQASPSPCRSRGTLAHRHGPKRLPAATQACSTAHPHQLWQRGPPQPPGRLTAKATGLTTGLLALPHLIKRHCACWPVRSEHSWHARICGTSPYRAPLATHENSHATPSR